MHRFKCTYSNYFSISASDVQPRQTQVSYYGKSFLHRVAHRFLGCHNERQNTLNTSFDIPDNFVESDRSERSIDSADVIESKFSILEKKCDTFRFVYLTVETSDITLNQILTVDRNQVCSEKYHGKNFRRSQNSFS